jgi:hypothetical protein
MSLSQKRKEPIVGSWSWIEIEGCVDGVTHTYYMRNRANINWMVRRRRGEAWEVERMVIGETQRVTEEP